MAAKRLTRREQLEALTSPDRKHRGRVASQKRARKGMGKLFDRWEAEKKAGKGCVS